MILGVSPLAFYDGIMFARRRLASPSFVIIVISCVRFRLSLLNPLGAIVFVFWEIRFEGNSGENFLHRVGENQGFASCLQFRLLFVFVANKIMTYVVFTERDIHIYDGGLNLQPPTTSKSETQL